MSITGMEQMAALTRQADVAQMQNDRKRAERDKKAQEKENAGQNYESSLVASLNPEEPTGALNEHDLTKRDILLASKGHAKGLAKTTREYYHDPNVGNNLDVSG
jgi:hypothetical protein